MTHSSVFWAEDVDATAATICIIDILEGVENGAPDFSNESDGKITFDAPPQGFQVRLPDPQRMH